EKVLAQVVPVLKGLGDDQGAAALLAMGHSFARQGKWPLARETFLLLAERYPAHPRAIEAYRWLIRLSSSAEARRRHELGQFYSVSHSTVVGPEGKGERPVQPAGFRQTSSGAFAGPDPSEAVNPRDLPRLLHHQRQTPLRNPEETKRWCQTSLDLG